MVDIRSILLRQQETVKQVIDFKLNSPYIHQLRQRYLSYVGRVGVPSIPQSLRAFNIK